MSCGSTVFPSKVRAQARPPPVVSYIKDPAPDRLVAPAPASKSTVPAIRPVANTLPAPSTVSLKPRAQPEEEVFLPLVVVELLAPISLDHRRLPAASILATNASGLPVSRV